MPKFRYKTVRVYIGVHAIGNFLFIDGRRWKPVMWDIQDGHAQFGVGMFVAVFGYTVWVGKIVSTKEIDS